MSKKIAEGTGALVLDVKVGSGAFMKDLDAARELARTMVDLGRDAGVATRALLTDMSVPLGRKIGNALEVEESVEVLAGGGPSDVVELTCELARNMLDLAGVHDADVEAALADGRAMDRWRAMIREQGGDPDAPLPRAAHTHQVLAEAQGTVVGMDALSVGVASWRLGAGRAVKEDPVQAGAGIEIHAKPGERVEAGQPLLTLHTDDEWRIERALEYSPARSRSRTGSSLSLAMLCWRPCPEAVQSRARGEEESWRDATNSRLRRSSSITSRN